MKAVYTERHRAHAPPHSLVLGRRVPYRDAAERAEAILASLPEAGIEVVEPAPAGPELVRALHNDDYVDFLASAYGAWTAAGYPPESVVPDVFPIRRPARRPRRPARLAGWHLFDTETPVVAGTFEAALGAASCAVTGARLLLEGERCAYALCRPPGHHAGRDYGGGYCYFNNAALAAHRLRCAEGEGRVAVLDLDYHHGNGTQDIFYSSGSVLYASVHADPARAFPYYWGYPDETGEGPGERCNLNAVLPPGAGEAAYADALARCLDAVAGFGPRFLVVSLGTDTSEEEPLGGFRMPPTAFGGLGERVGSLGLPTLVVQEGGYNLATIGACVTGFLSGLEGRL